MRKTSGEQVGDTSLQNGLSEAIPSITMNLNGGRIGRTLRIVQNHFPIDDSWPAPLTDPLKPIFLSPEKIDSELEWLGNGIRNGHSAIMQTSGPQHAHNILDLIRIERTEYSPHAMDVKKRRIMGRIHAIQEYFARKIIAGDMPALDQFCNFILQFSPPQYGDINKYYLPINMLCRTAGRLMGDTDSTEKLVSSQDKFQDILETRYLLEQSKSMDGIFGHYREALIYDIAWGQVDWFMGQLQKNNMFDEDGGRYIFSHGIVPVETNMETVKGIGVGINMFASTETYTPPLADRMDRILDELTRVKTNILPGGSQEKPVTYQIHMTEGMRLHDIWDIDNIHVVGQHPEPITGDSPLFLHIAMERSLKSPLYAVYDIRKGILRTLIPDIANFGGTGELHLHLYALISDLRHLERSGITIQENEDHKPLIGEKLQTPIKRSFVIGNKGIVERPSEEPTGSAFVTPREATLPYGSRFVAALAELANAQGENNPTKIVLAQAQVDQLARHLPLADTKTIQRYKEKAKMLGLDSRSIRVSNGRIVTAPKKGYEQPTFSSTPQKAQREIRLVQAFGSQALRINELLSAPEDIDVVFSDDSSRTAENSTVSKQSNASRRRLWQKLAWKDNHNN